MCVYQINLHGNHHSFPKCCHTSNRRLGEGLRCHRSPAGKSMVSLLPMPDIDGNHCWQTSATKGALTKMHPSWIAVGKQHIWNKKWCVSTCWILLVCFLGIQIFSRSPIANLPLALAWHWVMGLAVRTVTHAQLPSNPIVPIGEIGRAIRCRILSKLKPVCKSPEEIPRAKTRNHVSFTGTVPRVSLPLSEKWKVKFVFWHIYCVVLSALESVSQTPPIYHQYLWSQHFAGANILQVQIWLLYDVLCPATLMSSGHCLDQ